MSVFKSYSQYYDLLYRDKDYVGDVDYLRGLFRQHGGPVESILELGCGTGRHALLLAEHGHQVHGIDGSPEMLEVATRRVEEAKFDTAARLSFGDGDVRSYRHGHHFDVVVSLFHVFSYQTTDDDLEAAFATAATHLDAGGLFIFDCWYGPAVLSERPEVRVKRLEDEAIEVTRIAEPVIHPSRNVVDVNYTVFIKDKASNSVDQLQESHHMRYLFHTEAVRLLADHDLEWVGAEEWMSGAQPSLNTWGVCYIARRK